MKNANLQKENLNHEKKEMMMRKNNILKIMEAQVPERRIPREKYVPENRSLHLVDIENLMGGPRAGPSVIEWAVSAYQGTVPLAEGDHPVIGSNPYLWPCVDRCWSSARLVGRHGPDGADKALKEVVKNVDFILPRYDRIVVGSGDGDFLDVVWKYRARHLVVEVVARRRSLSRELAEAASRVWILPEPDFDLAA